MADSSRRTVLKAGILAGGAMLAGNAVAAASSSVQGWVAPGFEPVRAAFAANFEHYGEVGAGFCAYVRGQSVADLWGGVADRDSGRAWDRDTLIPVFSTTKVATAVCVHLLAQRGKLDLDAPVARYWPEFAQQGKACIPVRWLLTHRAGLPALERDFTMQEVLDWDPLTEALARQRPAWQPGTVHGYHARTFGWLAGEVVRRVSGRGVGRFFADEVAGPLGLDFRIGLPAAHEPRVGRLIPPTPPGPIDPGTLPEPLRRMLEARADPNSLTSRTLMLPTLDDNSRAVHAAEIPGHNGIATARSMARLAAAMVGRVRGIRLLTSETVRAATAVQSAGPDRVLFVDTTFGTGFMLDSSFSQFGGAGRFGHTGSGGALIFADPAAQLAVGYAPNQMLPSLLGPDPRTTALIRAVGSCL